MQLNQQKGIRSYNKALLVPLILVLSLIPLIVRAIKVNTKQSQFIWYSSLDETMDIFIYGKSITFLIISIFMLGIILTTFFKKKIKSNKVFIPLIIYAVLTILSTILSEYKYFSLHGVGEQYESIFILIGYTIVAYYSYLVVNTIEDVQTVMKWFIVGIVILVAIGLSQLFRMDFFRTALGKSIISSHNLEFKFPVGRVYTTLYNPNYVGIYVALVLPVILVCCLFGKNLKNKILYSILCISLVACVFGSESKTAMISISLSMLMLALLLRKFLLKHWIITFSIIAGFILMFFGINAITKNAIINNIKNTISATSATEKSLTSIQTKDDCVELIYNKELLRVQMNVIDNSYVFEFTDASGQQLNTKVSDDGKSAMIDDSRFSTISVYPLQYGDNIVFSVNIDGKDWYFTNLTDDGTYYYCNLYGKLMKLNETSQFKQSWMLLSKRGFIWDNTLPIIKEHPLLGTGPDTFPIYFPNEQYLNLYQADFNTIETTEIISKPHSLFLQIAAQTGIPSLLAFLTFYIFYFINSFHIYWRSSFSKYEEQIGVGIFIGSFAYMISAIVNDSTVAVSPVFWALIGLGLAINHMISKKNIETA